MMITSLYTYGGMKRFITKQYAKLDFGPIASNAVNSEYILEGFLQPRIYDAVKENGAYLNLIEHLGFEELSFENLAKVFLQSQFGNPQISYIYYKKIKI